MYVKCVWNTNSKVRIVAMFVNVDLQTQLRYKIFKHIYDKLSPITHYLSLPDKTGNNILSFWIFFFFGGGGLPNLTLGEAVYFSASTYYQT